MGNWMIRRASIPASLVIAVGVSTSCLAASCNVLGNIGAKLQDGQLFYRVSGMSAWTEMPEGGTSLGNTTSEFVYVLDEGFEKERSGVVIIKAARVRRSGEPAADPLVKSVRLVRHAQRFDNSPCGEVPAFGKGVVAPRSYDDYHDTGKSTADDEILDSFHFNYAARRGGCHMTNSSVGDSRSLYARSNRGQFSFDPDVVDRGTYLQMALLFHVSTASASSEKLANQRVETKQYHVSSGSPECISFKYRVPGTAAFLRINDLEALSGDGVVVPIRAPEHRWSGSPP